MATYLDYNATAPVRPQVAERMAELLGVPHNASSVHGFGRAAKKILEDSRRTIAEAIGVFPREIIFTATGSEANATALQGFPGRRVLVSAVEHSSVSATIKKDGIIPVLSSGVLNLEALEEALAEGQQSLVSIQLANNETGVIQPISDIAKICKKYGALLHSDAVQALGKIPVDFGLLGADMLTLSAHKMGGPVGAACLVVRQDVAVQPLIRGGGQELGFRAGTENIPAITGFAKAVELIDLAHMRQVEGWMRGMESELESKTDHKLAIASTTPRLPNTSCIAMQGVANEVQLMDFDLKGFAVSAGSACSSGRVEASHVLTAMGLGPLAKNAIRISAGWNTQEKEIISFTDTWIQTYKRLATNS